MGRYAMCIIGLAGRTNAPGSTSQRCQRCFTGKQTANGGSHAYNAKHGHIKSII